MKRILVTSDLSERSRAAVQRAVALTDEMQAKLTVLHVVDEAMPEPLAELVRKEAQARLSDEVASDAAGREIVHEVRVMTGDPIAVISEVAEQTQAELLIVGVHRRRAFLDQLKETTMEHLVRASDLPVLLVTQPAAGPYARVLSGVDLSPVCVAGLWHLRKLAPKAELTLFHAHKPSFKNEAAREFDTWKAVSDLPQDLPEPVLVEGSAADALEDLMEAADYELLALGAHSRSTAGRYLLGGFSAALIRKPPCDLLIAR